MNRLVLCWYWHDPAPGLRLIHQSKRAKLMVRGDVLEGYRFQKARETFFLTVGSTTAARHPYFGASWDPTKLHSHNHSTQREQGGPSSWGPCTNLKEAQKPFPVNTSHLFKENIETESEGEKEKENNEVVEGLELFCIVLGIQNSADLWF